jgi:hypothetical protein
MLLDEIAQATSFQSDEDGVIINQCPESDDDCSDEESLDLITLSKPWAIAASATIKPKPIFVPDLNISAIGNNQRRKYAGGLNPEKILLAFNEDFQHYGHILRRCSSMFPVGTQHFNARDSPDSRSQDLASNQVSGQISDALRSWNDMFLTLPTT